MSRWGRGSFGLMVSVSAVAYSILYQFVFILIYLVLLASSRNWHLVHLLTAVLVLPFYAIASGWFIVPVGMLFGAISALVSRKTESSRLWVMRGALIGSFVPMFSYLPVWFHFREGWGWNWAWLLTTISGAVAGAVLAKVMVRWRPLAVGHPDYEGRMISRPVAMPNRGTLLGITFAFATLGPIIGLFVTISGMGVLVGPGNLQSFLGVVTHAIGVAIPLAVPGFVTALITGFFSGLVSRGTLSTWRWSIYTAALGGVFSALSIQTALLVFLEANERGIWGSIAYSMGIMFVIGALSALVCAWICRKFRPRLLNLPVEPSASIAIPQ